MSQRSSAVEDDRSKLAERAKKLKLDGMKMLMDAEDYYFSSSLADATSGSDSFFSAHVAQPLEVIFQEWDALINSLRQQTFYNPVSLQEKMQVVQAMGFSKCETLIMSELSGFKFCQHTQDIFTIVPMDISLSLARCVCLKLDSCDTY